MWLYKMKINNSAIKRLLDSLDKRQNAQLSGIEQEILRHYKQALLNIQSEITNIYMMNADKIAEKKFTLSRLKNLKQQIKENIAQLYLKDATVIKNSLSDFYTQSYEVIGQGLNVGLNLDVIDERQIKAAVMNDYGKIKWKDCEQANIKQLIEEVRSGITQGFVNGKTLQQTSKVLIDRMNIGAGRAVRIVRTETHRIQNQGMIDGLDTTNKSAKLLGLEVEKFWQHNSRRDPRSEHIKMDGQTADEKGMFHFVSGDNAGKKTPGPGLSGIADEDINCGCTIGIRIKNL